MQFYSLCIRLWRRRGFLCRGAALGVVTVACLIAVAGCSPYPVFTHGTDRASEFADADEATITEAGDGPSYDSRARVSQASREIAPSSVDPRVFTRVVELYTGIPYKKGGQDADGIDCSNLVRSLFRDYSGKRLPTSTRGLYRLPIEVPRDQLQVGDLVFFSFGGRTPSHVGVFVGEGRFVHASESRGVIYSSMEIPYYRDSYRGARRVM